MKILLAYDGSGESNRAIECLNRLPIPLKSKVTMLHAVQPILSETSLMPEHDYSELMASNDKIHAHAKDLLAKAKDQYCSKDFDVEFVVEDGTASETILTVAERQNPDLIISDQQLTIRQSGLFKVKIFILRI